MNVRLFDENKSLNSKNENGGNYNTNHCEVSCETWEYHLGLFYGFGDGF